MRHPEHDTLVDTIRGWYTQSYPDMGYHTEERRFGFYSHNARSGSDRTNRMTLRAPSPFVAAELISDLRQYYADGPVQIWVDDPHEDERIGPLLEAHGCSRGTTTVYVAHVGEPPQTEAPHGVTVTAVQRADIDEYATVKLMAFSSSESPPRSDEVQACAALVAAEMSGQGRFFLARYGTEAVGVIAWYEGPPDRFIFQVGTRGPFRRRGVASYLVSRAVSEAAQSGCRSTIINADADDTVVHLYRRLGFTDQVLWHQGYLLPGDEAQRGAQCERRDLA